MAKAFSRALSYLTARSRTVHDLKSYLQRKDFPHGEIEETITRLLDLELLNDQRFAIQWVDYCIASKPLGRDRIRMELNKRGVAREHIDLALSAIDDEVELEMAEKLLANRPIENWSREKLYRFLRYRGFNNIVIEKIITRSY